MAGIFGVVRFDEGPADEPLAARMSAALAHRGDGEDAISVQDAAALGCRGLRATAESLHQTQPVRRPSGTQVVFDGRLDNRDDLVSRLCERCDVSPSTPDTDLVAALFDCEGPDFARHLFGDFAVAVYDPLNRRLVLARDVIGIRPLYYYRSTSAASFASEVKALSVDPAIRLRPHTPLLAELLLRRLHRRDHNGATLFEGIAEVPPAHVVILDERRSDVRRYWDFDGHAAIGQRTFDDYVEGFRFHFERAVRRRVGSATPVAVAVSGGVDSSAVFAVASRAAEMPLVGISYSTRDGGPADERPFLNDLENACARSIAMLDLPAAPDRPLFAIGELVRRVEAPMGNPEWIRADKMVAAARERGARTLISGHWGDQLFFDQAYLVDLLHSGSWPAIWVHLCEYRRWFPEASAGEFVRRFLSDVLEFDLPRVMRRGVRGVRSRWQTPAPWDDWFSASFRAHAAPDVFADELRRIDASGRKTTVLARALYREVRSRYHGLCLDWHDKMSAAHGVERAFPFLDRDLVEFVMGTPGEMLARGGTPKALLRAAVSHVVPASIVERRTKGDFTAAVNASSRRQLAAIRELLSRDAMVVQYGYVDADKLERGLAAADVELERSQSSIAAWRVTGLVAFEMWLREFFGNGNSRR